MYSSYFSLLKSSAVLLVGGLAILGCQYTRLKAPQVSSSDNESTVVDEAPNTAATVETTSVTGAGTQLSLCGMPLSQRSNAYPLEVYPLYLESSSHEWSWSQAAAPELIEVRELLCPNAHMGYIRGGPEGSENYLVSAVILGYVAGELQANKALEMLNAQLPILKSQEIIAATVGPAISLESLPSPLEVVAQRAKLSIDQAQALLEPDQYREIGLTFDVIVPTYIPEGYEVQSIEAVTRPANGYLAFAPEYSITYQSANDSCFRIYGATGQGGAAAEDVQYATADSALLGAVTLIYINFVQERDGSFLSFEGFQLPTKWGGSQLYSFGDAECSKTVSLNEAVKIVESFEYLNHPAY